MTVPPQGSYNPQPAPQPAQKSGCFKWVALGCAAITVVGIGAVAAIVLFVFGAIKSSAVYTGALDRAAHDPRVIAALGEPIEAGWYVMGTVRVKNSEGTASFDFPIHGPKGEASMHVEATRHLDRWSYSELTVKPHNGSTIDLLTSP